MRIDKFQSDVVRPEANREAPSASEPEVVRPAQAPAEAPRADRVEISEEGRALAENVAAAEGGAEGLAPERVSELREMVVGGKYDRPEVIAEVARRMSASGDLRSALSE